nr:hypothetical protein [Tanacetum cinerariifolium]
LQQVLNVCSALSKRVENLETANAAQTLEIIQLKARVKKLEKANMIKSLKLRRLRKVGTSRRVESSNDMEDVFNQGRMIADMDMNEGIELVKDAEVSESEGRNVAEHAEKQAEIYNLDLDHSLKVLSMQEDDSEVQEVVEVVTTAKLITEELPLKTLAETPKVKDKGKGILVEAPKPMKKKDQIEMDAEYARKLQEEIDRDHDGFNKRSGDVTRLQALVDKKRIVITKEVVREILTSWNEFSSAMASAWICLSSEAQVPAQGDDVQEPAAEEEVATDVLPPTLTSPSPSSPIIPSSPPHQPPCPPQPQDAEGSSLLFQRVLNTCSALARRVEDDVENVFNQGRIIVDMDQDEGIELVAAQEKDAEVEGRHVDKQAEIT